MARTAVIATVSPLEPCFGETLSTLHFAQRAKLVKNYAAPIPTTLVPPTPERARTADLGGGAGSCEMSDCAAIWRVT